MKVSPALADAIDQTADILENGWIQGDYQGQARESGSADQDPVGHCTLGALETAINCQNDLRNWDLYDDVETFLGVKLAESGRAPAMQFPAEWTGLRPASVPSWNDDHSRTKQEVLDFLREAAEEARRACES